MFVGSCLVWAYRALSLSQQPCLSFMRHLLLIAQVIEAEQLWRGRPDQCSRPAHMGTRGCSSYTWHESDCDSHN
jgi:hypothetical protein